MDAAELDLLYLALPYGSENGTTVAKLARMLDWPEDGRKVREGFRELRRGSETRRPVPVVALPVTNGVFIATKADLAALKRCAAGLHSRAMNQLVTERDLNEIIADFEWSPALFEVA
jgi:hypothetical protein